MNEEELQKLTMACESIGKRLGAIEDNVNLIWVICILILLSGCNGCFK